MTTTITTTTTATGNSKLGAARKAKNDEFYTRLEDIENELKHYREHFRDKVVLLNCDDPEWSNFWRYFELNFDFLGLKKLIATHYTGLGSENAPPSYKLELTGYGEAPVRTDLEGDGDFRSDECVALLEESDVVVTNPPFSLFREFVAQLIEHDKQFLILGNMNAITYKEVWPFIEDVKMWLGVTANSGERWFKVPSEYGFSNNTRVDSDGDRWIGVGVRWFTNLDHMRRHEELPLFRKYSDDPSKYPTYANYDAIEVSKIADIPVDYDGLMGVPITFMGKFNPNQFTIVGSSRFVGKPISDFAAKGTYEQGGMRFYLDKGDGTYRRMYERIVIRRKGATA